MDVGPQQAVAIPFRRERERLFFCLATTSGSGKWTLPKGITEPSATALETAPREAFEEAGLHGTLVGDPIGTFEQTRWGDTFSVEVYLMDVTKADTTWEEGHMRQRRWCDRHEALELVQGHPVADLFLKSLRRLLKT